MSDARLWLAVLVALPAAGRRRVVRSLLTSNGFGVWRSVGDRHAAGRARRRRHASAARALDSHVALTWIPGGEAIIRIDTLSAVLLPFAAGSVAAHGRRHAARGARSRRTAPDGARHAHHARVVSHGERGGAAAPVGGVGLDVPVCAGGPDASASAPRRWPRIWALRRSSLAPASRC